MTEPVSNAVSDSATAETTAKKNAAAPNRARRGGRGRNGPRPAEQQPAQAAGRSHPVLDQLAQWYPALFGEVLRPLKRGIFQDLMAAHPEALDPAALKVALGIHTRSTRYLNCVATGQARHDLQGQVNEPMAPEHVHHALMEVFRRRMARAPYDLRPKLIQRIAHNFEASGLERDEYAARVHTRDEAANAIVQEALSEAAARTAKAEALLRAFEASGQSLEAFADMYGMDPRQVGPMLERARHLRS